MGHSVSVRPATERPMRGMNPLYPWSDGKPMADNSLQYRWIVTIQGELEQQFRDCDDVFVAADNLIYPVKGDPKTCMAPDVYVAFGVPNEDRGSYLVFDEEVFPQVVFEVRSPKNRPKEMARKLDFYDRYGAEEYYDFDPKKKFVNVYVRSGGALVQVDHEAHVSPRIGLRFDLTGPEPVVYGHDGRRFRTRLEVGKQAEEARRQAYETAAELARLREKLKAAGIDPDALG